MDTIERYSRRIFVCGLLLGLLLAGCGFSDARPESPAPGSSQSAPASDDPFVGQWTALPPFTQRPRTLTVMKNADQSYRVVAPNGDLNTPTAQDDGTLYAHSDDALFSHPWSRYRYDEATDQLHLITADDEQNPQRYERSR